MRANPDEIRTIGEDLLNRTTAAQAEPLSSGAAGGGGPLGQQLLAVHAQKAAAATEFLDTAHQGIAQAANTLVQVAADLAQFDKGGAGAITQALG